MRSKIYSHNIYTHDGDGDVSMTESRGKEESHKLKTVTGNLYIDEALQSYELRR